MNHGSSKNDILKPKALNLCILLHTVSKGALFEPLLRKTILFFHIHMPFNTHRKFSYFATTLSLMQLRRILCNVSNCSTVFFSLKKNSVNEKSCYLTIILMLVTPERNKELMSYQDISLFLME